MSKQQSSPQEPFGLDGALTGINPRQAARTAHGHTAEEGSNDHLASIYEEREDQFAAAVPFIKHGLERGEQCLYIVDENTREDVLDALREEGVDVEAACASGALSIRSKADTYLRTGEFDQEAMLDFWEESLAEARDEAGFEGVRAAAEMTWALDDDTGLDQLVEYEALLNTIYPDEEYVVLCQYNRDRFPSDVLSDVIRSHPLVVYDGTVCRNFYYRPPRSSSVPTTRRWTSIAPSRGCSRRHRPSRNCTSATSSRVGSTKSPPPLIDRSRKNSRRSSSSAASASIWISAD